MQSGTAESPPPALCKAQFRNKAPPSTMPGRNGLKVRSPAALQMPHAVLYRRHEGKDCVTEPRSMRHTVEIDTPKRFWQVCVCARAVLVVIYSFSDWQPEERQKKTI